MTGKKPWLNVRQVPADKTVAVLSAQFSAERSD